MTDKTYRIKPLEWQETKRGTWVTKCGLIALEIWEDSDGWKFGTDDDWIDEWFGCDSLEDGKAKAEAWFFERILPALEEVQQ